MAFDTGMNDAMETMMARGLGRTTHGGGRMNAMVATSGTFDGGAAGTLNGMRMGIMEERQAEYEHSHRSPLDVNMEMMTALRGDVSAADLYSGGPSASSSDYGTLAASGPSYGSPSFDTPSMNTLATTGPTVSSPSYGAPSASAPTMGGPSMPTPAMTTPSMPSPAMTGPAATGPSVASAPAASGAGAPSQGVAMVVIPADRQRTPDVVKSKAPTPEPMVISQGAGSIATKEDGDEEENKGAMPSRQHVAQPEMLRPSTLPPGFEVEASSSRTLSREQLLERKLQKLSNEELEKIVEDATGELASANSFEEVLLAETKLEILEKEAIRRSEAGIL